MKKFLLFLFILSTSLHAEFEIKFHYKTSQTAPKTYVFEYINQVEIDTNFTGLNGVDSIYVINLDKRIRKWSIVKSQFNEYGISPIRMRAIDGSLLSEEIKKRLAGPYPIRLRGGQTGCLLSHLSCLRDALKKDFDVIWICEDDIKILDNPHKISYYLAELNSLDENWDILYTDIDSRGPDGNIIKSLSSDFRPDMKDYSLEAFIDRTICTPNIMKIGQRFGNYSYLISKKGIKKILDYFDQNFLWTAYDIEIHYIPGIREYSLTCDLVSFDWTLPSDNF